MPQGTSMFLFNGSVELLGPPVYCSVPSFYPIGAAVNLLDRSVYRRGGSIILFDGSLDFVGCIGLSQRFIVLFQRYIGLSFR